MPDLSLRAKQADDKNLRQMADRIQGRRCGELLKTFQTGPSGGRPKNGEGDRPVSQSQMGRDAGMSSHQVKTAVRVAKNGSVPQVSLRQSGDTG